MNAYASDTINFLTSTARLSPCTIDHDNGNIVTLSNAAGDRYVISRQDNTCSKTA